MEDGSHYNNVSHHRWIYLGGFDVMWLCLWEDVWQMSWFPVV